MLTADTSGWSAQPGGWDELAHKLNYVSGKRLTGGDEAEATRGDFVDALLLSHQNTPLVSNEFESKTNGKHAPTDFQLYIPTKKQERKDTRCKQEAGLIPKGGGSTAKKLAGNFLANS